MKSCYRGYSESSLFKCEILEVGYYNWLNGKKADVVYKVSIILNDNSHTLSLWQYELFSYDLTSTVRSFLRYAQLKDNYDSLSRLFTTNLAECITPVQEVTVDFKSTVEVYNLSLANYGLSGERMCVTYVYGVFSPSSYTVSYLCSHSLGTTGRTRLYATIDCDISAFPFTKYTLSSVEEVDSSVYRHIDIQNIFNQGGN